MKIHTIYGLMNPLTRNIFYVGETTNMKGRYANHFSNDNSGNEKKDAEINLIRSQGERPLLVIFQSCKMINEYAAKRESFYIKRCKEQGYVLLNMNQGGNKPPSQKGKKLNHGRKLLEATPLKKTVYQYDNNGNCLSEYISVREAGRVTGIDHRSIQSVAAGTNPKRHSAGGFKWKYKKS